MKKLSNYFGFLVDNAVMNLSTPTPTGILLPNTLFKAGNQGTFGNPATPPF